MEGVESKSQSQGRNSQIMAENVEGFKQCVKEILDLIKQDEKFSDITAEDYDCKKLNLTKLVNVLSRMHGALADQNVNLIKEVNKNTHKFTTPIKTQQIVSSGSTSPQATESSKKHEFMTPVGFNFTFSSGGGFQISRSQCSESSILKSSNSASESESIMSINKLIVSPVNDDALKIKETKVHDTEKLLKKISILEEELSTSNKKVQSLEDENALLEAEKAKVAELKLVIRESTRKIETMAKVIEVYRTQVLTADNEISKLKQELSRKDIDQTQFLSLGQTIASLQKQLDSKQSRNDELHEKAIRFTADISKRDDEITELSTKINLMRIVHAAEEDKLKTDIGRLETEVREKCELVDDLNQKHDAAVMSCRDELKVKVVELEREVEVVSEEKREAIRQLSFTVDHYMSAYKQLRQALVSLKRRFV